MTRLSSRESYWPIVARDRPKCGPIVRVIMAIMFLCSQFAALVRRESRKAGRASVP